MNVKDEMDALLLLSSLPDRWETMVVLLSNSAPNVTLTMDVVNDSLFNEEQRRTYVVTNDESHFLSCRVG